MQTDTVSYEIYIRVSKFIQAKSETDEGKRGVIIFALNNPQQSS